MRTAKQNVKRLKTKGKPTERAMKKVTKLQGKLKKSEDALYAEKSADDLKELQTCIGAFVVFNHVESHNRCLEAYRHSTRWLGRKFQHKELKFRGTHALKIIQAPEPSDIQWENLDKSTKELVLRKLFTLFVTFLLLIVSIMTILWAQGQKKNFAEKTPDISLCKIIPVAFFGDYAVTEDLFYSSLSLTRIPQLDEKCTAANNGQESFYISYGDAGIPLNYEAGHEVENFDPSPFGINTTYYSASQDLIAEANLKNAFEFGSAIWMNETAAKWRLYENRTWETEFEDWSTMHPEKNPVRCDSPCVTPESDALCRFPCFQNYEAGSEPVTCPQEYDGANRVKEPTFYSQTDLAGCYCKDRLALEIANAKGILGFFDVLAELPEEEKICKDFIEAYASSLGVVIGAAAMIAIINTGLKIVLKKLAKFEGHDSLSDQAASVSINLLIVQFINTALISYLVNLSYQGEGLGTVIEFFKLFGMFNGEYEGFPPSCFF
jgi:hypothetical protein